MNYERLLFLICVAAISAGSTLAALIVMGWQGRLPGLVAGRPPRVRARMLLTVRLAPMVAGALTMVGVAFAFVRYEPRQTTEEAGVVLLSVAGWALLAAAVAVWRLTAAARRTAECHRLVQRCGQRVDIPGFPLPAWRVTAAFPVAAVSGILRPRLILSSRILDECSPEELAAVLRHERAHVRRRDNLVRALLIGIPDALAIVRRDDALIKQWHDAVEEAADDEAVERDVGAPVALATALVRVGRMATEAPPPWMPALALFDGDNLEERVRRLLEARPSPPRHSSLRQRAAVVLLGVLISAGAAWAATGPRPLHVAVEWVVRNLP